MYSRCRREKRTQSTWPVRPNAESPGYQTGQLRPDGTLARYKRSAPTVYAATGPARAVWKVFCRICWKLVSRVILSDDARRWSQARYERADSRVTDEGSGRVVSSAPTESIRVTCIAASFNSICHEVPERRFVQPDLRKAAATDASIASFRPPRRDRMPPCDGSPTLSSNAGSMEVAGQRPAVTRAAARDVGGGRVEDARRNDPLPRNGERVWRSPAWTLWSQPVLAALEGPSREYVSRHWPVGVLGDAAPARRGGPEGQRSSRSGSSADCRDLANSSRGEGSALHAVYSPGDDPIMWSALSGAEE